MFDKEKFSEILKSIYNSYENQRAFAEATGVNRAYLSRYMNMKIDNPPSPKILKNIADGAKNITTYDELMNICGYADTRELIKPNNSLFEKADFYTIPTFINHEEKLEDISEDIILPSNLDQKKQYFAYKTNDESMSPLLSIGDIAIIEKTNKYTFGKIFLVNADSKILIRRIVKTEDGLELQAMNPYYPVIKTKNVIVYGKVVKSENESAFK